MEIQRTRKAKIILQKNKSGELTLPSCKSLPHIYSNQDCGIVLKINIQINKIEILTFIFNQGGQEIQWSKSSLLTNNSGL